MNRLSLAIAVVAASAAAWSLAIGAHELIGHGGACLLLDQCSGNYADAMYYGYDFTGAASDRALVLIGGPLATFLVGLAGVALRIEAKRARPALDWFAWCLIPACWISGGAYIAFGQFIHPGMDTAHLVRMGGENAPMIIAAVGSTSIIAGVISSGLLMPHRLNASSRFMVIASAVAGYAIAALGAALLVPGERGFLLMGAIGASILFTAPLWLAALPWPSIRARGEAAAPGVVAIGLWLGLTAAYVLVLGPGIHFG